MPRSLEDWEPVLRWIAAIGHPTRMTILATLATGEKTISQLTQACRAEMMTLYFHLRILRKVGLVAQMRRGGFLRFRHLCAAVSGVDLILTHESGVRVIMPLE
jgi:DNA-binding transcriptional ArsR family regulator